MAYIKRLPPTGSVNPGPFVTQWSSDMTAVANCFPMEFFRHNGNTCVVMARAEGSGYGGYFRKRTGAATWANFGCHDICYHTGSYPCIYEMSATKFLLVGNNATYTGNGRVQAFDTEVFYNNENLNGTSVYYPAFVFNGTNLFVEAYAPPWSPGNNYTLKRANLSDPIQSWATVDRPAAAGCACMVPFNGVWNSRLGYYTSSGGILVYTAVANGPIISRPGAIYRNRLYWADYTNQRVLLKNGKDGPWAQAFATTGYNAWCVASGGGVLLVGAARIADFKAVILRYVDKTASFVEEYVATSGTYVNKMQYVEAEGCFYASVSTGAIFRGIVKEGKRE